MTAAAATVLLLDDHAIVLEGLERALERAGMDVVGKATDTDAAIRIAGESKPDLCLVDLRLRDSSGIDAIPGLLAAHPTTKVVILTSFDDGRAARDALAAGASGFLLKDSGSEELCGQLLSVIGGATVIDDRVRAGVFSEPTHDLSEQDVELLQLLADGASNAEAARTLHLSPHTVKDHVARIMRSLQARTRAEAVARAITEGILDSRR